MSTSPATAHTTGAVVSKSEFVRFSARRRFVGARSLPVFEAMITEAISEDLQRKIPFTDGNANQKNATEVPAPEDSKPRKVRMAAEANARW